MEINKKKITKFKHLIFKKERHEILSKILLIIGITETNKIFYSHILDQNDENQRKILDMKEEIKKYFKVSSWPAYKKGLNVGRKYISIIKSLLHDMDIKFTSASLKLNYNNKTINTTMYTIIN